MRDHPAAEAVPDQNGTRRVTHGLLQLADPLLAVRPMPILLLDPYRTWIRTLPERLPMLGAGSSEPGNNQELHGPPSWPASHSRVRCAPVSLGVDRIEHAAVVEVGGLRFPPAAEIL